MNHYYKLLIGIVFISACSQQKDDDKKKDAPVVSTNYQTIKIQRSGLPAVLRLPAQLAAYQEVAIFPKVNGYVKSVLVDIGQRVSKGSLLMILEAPELEQAALQAKEKYTRTRSELAIDSEHYLRLLEASRTSGAVSPFDLSTTRSKVASDSALCNAEKANWEMQKTMMDYLRVTAPFAGVITERNIHPGALVNAASKDKPMLQLKEISHLRLQVEIPESVSAELKERDTVSFFTSTVPGKKNLGYVNRKSGNINPQLRSEKIEIDVLNTDNSLSPGMYADVVIYVKGNPDAFTVPKSCVVSSTERKYVIVLRNGKINKVDVITRNETAEKIEIFGPLQPGDELIINANDEIK